MLSNCCTRWVNEPENIELYKKYRARVEGYGKVFSQQPRAGSASKQGSTVVLNMK